PPWMYTATGNASLDGSAGAHTFRFRQSSPVPLSASSQPPLSGCTGATPLRSYGRSGLKGASTGRRYRSAVAYGTPHQDRTPGAVGAVGTVAVIMHSFRDGSDVSATGCSLSKAFPEIQRFARRTAVTRWSSSDTSLRFSSRSPVLRGQARQPEWGDRIAAVGHSSRGRREGRWA